MDTALPHLRVIARHGVGVDGIALAAAEARDIAVTRVAGANAPAIAEHAFAMMMALLKDLPAAAMRAGAWEKTTRITRDAAGTTLGILGYGAIGARLADAFGMCVLAVDPALPPEPGARVETLETLLPEAEVLSLHCPLTEGTRGLIRTAALARFRRGAILINTARGASWTRRRGLPRSDAGHAAGRGSMSSPPSRCRPKAPCAPIRACLLPRISRPTRRAPSPPWDAQRPRASSCSLPAARRRRRAR